jgi:hypothetical protein
LDIFKQFLEAAYTPEFEKDLNPLDQNQPKKKSLYSVNRDNQEGNWDCGGQILRSEETKEALNVQKKHPDLLENHKVELEKLSNKIIKEITEAPRWEDFSSEIGEIAMEIEDKLFDDIILDLCSCTL